MNPTTVFQYNVPAENNTFNLPDMFIELKAVKVPSGISLTVLTQLHEADMISVIDWRKVFEDCNRIASDHFLAQKNVKQDDPSKILCVVHDSLMTHFTRNTM